MKIKTPILRKLIKEADTLYSKLTRLELADNFGICTCITCDRRLHWTVMQLGHWEDRGNTKSRYSIFNTHAQCPICNAEQKLQGKNSIIKEKFRQELIARYGEENVMGMQKDYKVNKLYKSDLIEKIKEYEERIAELVEK